MKIKPIIIGNITANEIISEEVIVRNEQDALDIMSVISSDHIVLHEYNFENDFFDLSTKIAGGILQKFANYRIKLAIIGDFNKYPSKTLKDFIYESNKQGDYLFVLSMNEVMKIWKE